MKHIISFDKWIDSPIKCFEELDHDELQSLEDYADYLFSKLGVNIVFTKHFKQRINDARNLQPISYDEISDFFLKAYHEAGQEIAELPDETAAVLKDLVTRINVPFKIEEEPSGETDVVLMSVMRKKNYLSPDPEIVISAEK